MKKIAIGSLLVFILLAGCSTKDNVTTFTHIHGADFSPQEPYDLLIATHHGLVRLDADGNWRWAGQQKDRHDLMGFAVLNDGRMMASGHPHGSSDLVNPLGVVLSNDQGKTWAPIAFHGEIDFHMMTVHANDSNIVYAIDQHGSQSGLYRSLDGGNQWTKLNPMGLPSNLDQLRTIVIDPANTNRLMVGAIQGMYLSEDGGDNWRLHNNKMSMTASKVVFGQKPVTAAYLLGDPKGLMTSSNFGETWEPLNLVFTQNDAAAAIAIHPTKEGVYAVATLRNHVYQTVDNGATWIQLAKDGKPL